MKQGLIRDAKNNISLLSSLTSTRDERDMSSGLARDFLRALELGARRALLISCRGASDSRTRQPLGGHPSRACDTTRLALA